ncbi:MAG: saccharopine dehydrogenase NADP-binding domain-containing protein [Acidimicrobiia bacterium]|nr:saccharopine dehydrogenase NADP-binding domain-containing protein [Acidimicrobiia bacterium]
MARTDDVEAVAVLGLGKVGLLAARLLADAGFHVVGHDVRPRSPSETFPVKTTDVSDTEALAAALADRRAVLSCLPYSFNIGVADVAHRLGIHYFDLTEDVATTRHIRALAETSAGVMAPQCGLAPGFVGIVAASQAESFDRCRSIRMRVGALPEHPTGLLGYAFNWSPEGVVNEYLNDCEVIEEGVHKWVSPMEWKETVYVAGTRLEAFTTSGGLGTMCETYLDRVENLDYKTLRYPGHMDLMNFFFHELLMRERRELAGEILTNAKPPVATDAVYIHVASEGWTDDQLKRVEFVRKFRPIVVGGERATAIAWTTAGSVASVIQMVRDGLLPERGFIRQEEIPFDSFLATTTGRLFGEPL